MWASGFPPGFPQQGQGNGAAPVSTDYYAADKGTAANPLTLDACTPQPCSQDAVYPQSNSFRQNVLREVSLTYGGATAKIQQRLMAQCANEPGCQERAAAVERRDPAIYKLPANPNAPQGTLAPYYWRSGTSPVK